MAGTPEERIARQQQLALLGTQIVPISDEERAFNKRVDSKAAALRGQAAYESQDRWQGGRGFGGLVQAGLNFFDDKEGKIAARTATALQDIQDERTGKGFKQARAAQQEANKTGAEKYSANRSREAAIQSVKPYEDGKGGVVNVARLGDGSTWTVDPATNKPTQQIDVNSLIPYSPSTKGSSERVSAAQLKQDAETDVAMATVDPLIRDFSAAFDDSTREQLYDATGGWTDWKAMSTRMGLGSENDSEYQARQNIQLALNSGVTTLVGGSLEKFTGSKSDAELAEVMKGIADSTAEPLTYLSQIRRQVIPRLREIYRRGGKDTAESEAFLAELESRVTGWEEKFAIIGQPTAPDGQKLNKGVRSIKVVSE